MTRLDDIQVFLMVSKLFQGEKRGKKEKAINEEKRREREVKKEEIPLEFLTKAFSLFLSVVFLLLFHSLFSLFYIYLTLLVGIFLSILCSIFLA